MSVHPLPAAALTAPAYRIAGVDEVGRGPLAGPVVAAAVILDPVRPIDGLDDSKVLDVQTREALAVKIRQRAAAWCVASASVEEIDALNIYHASLLAMERAVAGLSLEPSLLLVDGKALPKLRGPAVAVIKGDGRVASIGAASIIAKVARDALMEELHRAHPCYGFDRHKGYPTPEHRLALRQHGPCLWHRRSFAPVAACSPCQDLLSPELMA